MKDENSMTVSLLGLNFTSGNLGCGALAYAFLQMLDDAASEKNAVLGVNIISQADRGSALFEEYRNLRVTAVKSKYRDFKAVSRIFRILRASDYVFDFTEGDSFTDLYGKKRYLLQSMFKAFAISGKAKFVMGPQTYGPFDSKLSRAVAAWILKRTDFLFARDTLSCEFVEKTFGRRALLSSDVAFALPKSGYASLNSEKKKLGINVSGLLWNGGYTGGNQFGLKLDYQKYVLQLIAHLGEEMPEYEIHLISHVTSENDAREDDHAACVRIAEQFPNVVVAPTFASPMEAKGYIANMDAVVASRMHASIAAVSQGIPTVPVSYSRKFEGLYGTIGYPVMISARELDTESAVLRTLEALQNLDELAAQAASAAKRAKTLNEAIRSYLRDSVVRSERDE